MIRASVIQDYYSGGASLPDETCAGEPLRKACEAFKDAVLQPQMALAEEAAERGTDLIVLREDCNGASNYAHRIDRPDLFELLAEPIPGPTFERLANLARRANCHVSACFNERLDGRIYNTAVLVDPRGALAAKYHKTHLPPLERFQVTPGNDLPVFDTEIGRVGMLICYDMMTPETTRVLALKGADLILWPSLGYGWWEEAGDFTIQSRAHDNQVYILGALPANSCIVNPSGDFLAQARAERRAAICAEIHPGEDPVQPANHHNAFLTSTTSLRERHLFERRPELYGEITRSEPELAGRYPQTRMHELEQNRREVFDRYQAEQGRLTWQTRPDRPTRP